ncbi:hypothetical protein [Chitinophaga varians]|uniref:hypothetical protein n=1 Tax=Chitinophaga varians TaxID=2202339 RepID=UPI00165FC7A5|nr:hypothetical protein [Chitinophaga varians]MBC9909927.1 hypothetical protein [Chitinophaga varians]
MIILLYSLTGCKNKQASAPASAKQEAIPTSLYIDHDTILTTINHDTLRLTTEVYNTVADYFPSLLSPSYATHPDVLYLSGTGSTGVFESEAGRDYFCEVYYFFMMQQKKAIAQNGTRLQLQKLFSAINDLEGRLHCGGTYFGHRQGRLPAYAVYAAYYYPEYQTEKTYDITPQKRHYIAMLRQMTADEITEDDCIGAERRAISEQLANIDKLITSKFYLRECLTFQNGGYDFE